MPLTRTLRTRLTVWHVSVLGLALGTFAFLCYLVVSSQLYHHHDEELERQAAEIQESLLGVPLNQQAIRDALQGAAVGTRFVMVRDARGGLLYRDPTLDTAEPDIGHHELLVHAAADEPPEAVFFTVDLAHTPAVRFICVPLAQPDTYLQVGDPLGDVQTMVRAVGVSWLPILPAVLLLSGLGGWLITRRALAPVSTIAGTLQMIQASNLSGRVDRQPQAQELDTLVMTLNDLLSRLERAFVAQREFAGDVSHQVQTPLMIIKGDLERAVRDPQRPRDAAWMRGILTAVDDIRRIVLDLQSLALADAPVGDASVVSLTEVVRDAGAIVEALGEVRGVTVSCDQEAGLSVSGDATRLKQLVLNLGENAVKYTAPGGHVSIDLRADGDTAVLRITDTGIGIDPAQLPRLFDRHFRATTADRAAHGMGLGLAIAKRIVDAHHGTITVTSTPGSGSTFTVRLPRSF